ncbi:kinase-like domain-containing protein [Calycina marina]|uniref:non-specific serine/threonine protein kinase n=1 Tax=Calycina marina TaxID=1763456 RepID=A0A9P8CDE1_9HELO|nr:kinase-like domain-containing protein [Calycina marina]
MSFLAAQLDPPTVVRKTPGKNRPSLFPINPESAQDDETKTSSEFSGDKSSSPSPRDSTGKTSVDSKYNAKSAGHTNPGSDPLASISEVTPLFTKPVEIAEPTIQTVEKASAAKIFFETHYHRLTSSDPTARSVRCRKLKGALYEDNLMTNLEKDEKLLSFYQRESDHLRELRVMKAVNAREGGKEKTALQYEVVRVLGKGSFGVVRLVREKTPEGVEKSKEVFAMKVIKKSDMLRNSQEGHLRAERDFLVAAEGSRWIVALRASFQDMRHLYLVMDYMPGGDFLGLLIRDNILPEPVAKWYIAEMILCIEETHALRWIHRDVKPDNFLISASGHLKISDFGLAFDGHWSHDQSYFNNHRYSILKKLGINVEGDALDQKEAEDVAAGLKPATPNNVGRERHERTSSTASDDGGLLNWRNRYGNRTLARSVVGTSQYMAPEVVRGERYDARCDWWSVAIILYECLYGHTPFLAEEGGRHQTKVNINNHAKTFAFPHKPIVSRRCQDLMRDIICAKDDRLCSKRYNKSSLIQAANRNRDYAGRYVYPYDAEDIKSHRFFKDVDWAHLHLMTPPFVPNIKSTEDTHYFDEEDPISDFSDSVSCAEQKIGDIENALRPFSQRIQLLATGFIDRPHDSVTLRKFDRDIDNLSINAEQKTYLKGFGRHYGPKDRKRPRDKLLRDRSTAPKVLQLRKQSAFLGYTYRRIRGGKEGFKVIRGPMPRAGSSVVMNKSAWHRARLSIH